VLTLDVRGPLTVTMNGTPTPAELAGELEITLAPVFGPGENLRLEPAPGDIVVRRWTASVTSPGTPPEVADHLVGDAFRLRLQDAVRFAVAVRLVNLPSDDVSFFGPLARIATSVCRPRSAAASCCSV